MVIVLLNKIRRKKILIAGLIFLLIAFTIRYIEGLFTIDYYKNPEFFCVWSKWMMPSPGPPPKSYIVLSMISIYITGVVLAVMYDGIRVVLPKGYWNKVIAFSLIVIAIWIVFTFIPIFLLINYPLPLLVYGLITEPIIFFITAMVFIKFMD